MTRELLAATKQGKTGVLNFAENAGEDLFSQIIPKQLLGNLKNLGFKSRNFDGKDPTIDPKSPLHSQQKIETAMGISEVGHKLHTNGKALGKNPAASALGKLDPLGKNTKEGDNLLGSLFNNLPGGNKTLDGITKDIGKICTGLEKLAKKSGLAVNPLVPMMGKIMGMMSRKSVEGFAKGKNEGRKDPEKGAEAKKGGHPNEKDMDKLEETVKDTVKLGLKLAVKGIQLAANFLIPGSGIAASLAQKGMLAGMKGVTEMAGEGKSKSLFPDLKKISSGVKAVANKGMQTGQNITAENDRNTRERIHETNP